jgi:hypothetical protein
MNGFQQDPWGPTGAFMGPEFNAPNPYNDFMFSQNPNSMAAPSFGIAPGGEAMQAPAPYMQPQFAQQHPGTNWGDIAGAAGKALGAPQMPRDPQMSSGSARLGNMPQEYKLQFILPLAELAANREAAFARLRKK